MASIAEDADSRVEGVLYRISWGDLKEMDRYEGVHVGMYRRVEVPVHVQEEVNSAWTYISRVDEGAPFPTTGDYIGTILRGAIEHGLSEGWIRFLKDFPVRDQRADP